MYFSTFKGKIRYPVRFTAVQKVHSINRQHSFFDLFDLGRVSAYRKIGNTFCEFSHMLPLFISYAAAGIMPAGYMCFYKIENKSKG